MEMKIHENAVAWFMIFGFLEDGMHSNTKKIKLCDCQNNYCHLITRLIILLFMRITKILYTICILLAG